MGLVFQSALTLSFILLQLWSGSEALRGLAYLAGSGITVWLFLVLIYHQRVLVQEESFESEQLRREREREGAGKAIFDVADEQLLLARRRLRWMYKWLLPVFTVVLIGTLSSAGFFRWQWAWGTSLGDPQFPRAGDVSRLIWFVGGAAFLSFLMSRYVVGMARHADWRLLHAGASFLMGVTLGAVAVVIGLAAQYFSSSPAPEHAVAYGLRGLLLVIAAEILLNFVLDFYRPRSPDEEPRPAFDSRLFGLFTEPGGIARSIAEAINYQFGFEVSSTWFYKLLQRSVGPLAGFAALMLFLASSLVFVNADERAIIEHFGRKQRAELGPGMHLKWPWPIDIAYKVGVNRIHELRIGIASEDPAAASKEEEDLILWTNKHSQEPHLEVLIATPKLERFLKESAARSGREAASRPAEAVARTQPAEAGLGQAEQAAPVSILRVAVTLQYKIRDAYQWINTHAEPVGLLESLANREILLHCASAEMIALLGPQRAAIEKELWKAVQVEADRLELGVDIVFLGLQGVHPPESTAEEFQNVIGAEQQSAASVNNATAEYRKRLSEVAGDYEKAEQLAQAIRDMKALEADSQAAPEKVEAARNELKRRFEGDTAAKEPGVGGAAAEILLKARARRWHHENQALGQSLVFTEEIRVKNAAPEAYRWRKYLEALSRATRNIRKYVVASGTSYHLNLQDPMNAPLSVDLQQEQK